MRSYAEPIVPYNAPWLLGVVALTTIQLEGSTRDQLKAIGRKGETYDLILRRLLAAAEFSKFVEEQYKILDTEKHWVRLRDIA